jgi:hypothetical protein
MGSPRRVCRWAVDCAATATTTVQYSQLGPIEACGEHAAEHATWTASAAVNLAEPAPECWRPDPARDISAAVDYCPAHATHDPRGLDPFTEPEVHQ